MSTAALTRSYPFSKEPTRISYCEVNKTIINSIRIYITDVFGRIINLKVLIQVLVLSLKLNKICIDNIMGLQRR